MPVPPAYPARSGFILPWQAEILARYRREYWLWVHRDMGWGHMKDLALEDA